MKTIVSKFIFLILLLLSFTISLQAANVKISPDKLAQYINGDSLFNFILVDLRDPPSSDNVIASEVCKPYNLSWNTNVFQGILSKIPRATPIILYCQSGYRSSLAATMLVDSGFTDIKTLDGGINNWNKSLMPKSYIKATSDLPAFSFTSTRVNTFAITNIYNHTISFNNKTGLISVPASISETHSLDFYDIRGRIIYRAENIFSKNTKFLLSNKCSKGKYLVIFRTKENSQLLPITISE